MRRSLYFPLIAAALWAAALPSFAAGLDDLAGLDPSGAAALSLPGACPAPSPAAPARAGGALHAWFISVGQGDSEFLELPNGKTALIDGGPADPTGAGDPPLARFLAQHGVTSVDYVVLTHPHADHFTGLRYVFSHARVGNFYDTREDNPGAPTLKLLRGQAAASGAAVSYPAAGDELPWDAGEVEVKVLNSCSQPGQSTAGNVLNDCSIVLKITYQNTSMLLTGDMQGDIEARLVSQYGAGLQSDVLKVGHHGSATASTGPFLAAVRPKYAYIEVGTGNTFGHPTQAALARLQAAGARVFRTDLDGTQEYTIGGD